MDHINSSPDHGLWIDTLCVPLDRDHRKTAIKRLKDTYQKAKSVLVLDKRLLRFGPHDIERRVQLLCSDWMRRLWTMQEGLLAQKLYIVFEEGPVALEDFLDEKSQEHRSGAWSSMSFLTYSHLSGRFLRGQDSHDLLNIAPKVAVPSNN